MDCNHCQGARSCTCEVETDRQRFIRRAAIAFASLVDDGPATHAHSGSSGLLMKPVEAWGMAMRLWQTKPEDC